MISLEFENNPLSEISGPFLFSKSLHNLDLRTCGIRNLNHDFFKNTTSLNTLDLSHNPLDKIDSGTFDYVIFLQNLKLSNCSLTAISSDAFKLQENLQQLELDENNLRSVDWTAVLKPLVRLERLNLRKTGITSLPGDAFDQNLYLRELILADNEIHHLDVVTTLGHNLHSLRFLDLSNCNLQDRLSEEAFRNASNLRILNLSGNPMFASDLNPVLSHLPKLDKLSLSNCSLRRLPESFDSLQELQDLDISNNPLSDAFVSLLNPLKSLEYLDMSYCNLGYVSNKTFTQMTSLKKLKMSGNILHTLEEGLFTNLSRLETLELENCGLMHPLDPKVFGDRNYTNIIELKLRGNPLPAEGPLLPQQLSGIESIDLSHCNISYLEKNVFSHTPHIKSLNLANNKLTSGDNLSFLSTLRSLERLDLSNNKLTAINPSLFDSNGKINSLNLMNNPFACTCTIADMWVWALQKKGNLDVLVGSQQTEFTSTSAKRRKSLSCSYDPETYRSLNAQSSRKNDPSPKRTWAKYVRESMCPAQS